MLSATDGLEELPKLPEVLRRVDLSKVVWARSVCYSQRRDRHVAPKAQEKFKALLALETLEELRALGIVQLPEFTSEGSYQEIKAAGLRGVN